MCWCRPEVRTPFCGRPECVPPGSSFRVDVPLDLKNRMNEIGGLIGAQLPPGWGFGLFIFTYGEGGTMTWISSARRDDMVKALQEWMRAEGS